MMNAKIAIYFPFAHFAINSISSITATAPNRFPLLTKMHKYREESKWYIPNICNSFF